MDLHAVCPSLVSLKGVILKVGPVLNTNRVQTCFLNAL